MTKRVDALRNEAGFTIIEVMVGAMLLVIGLMGTLTLFDTGNRLSVQNKDRVGAVNLAREVAENIRSLDYDRIDSTNIVSDLAATGLVDQNATASGIQVQRGKVTYTVQVIQTSGGNTTSPCVLDSATDGARASTDGNFYCAGSPVAGSTAPRIDGNPDDFRRVQITVTWPGPQGTAACSGLDNGIGRSCVMQPVLIQNPSGGIGPSIDTITLRSTGLTLNSNGDIEDGAAAIFDVTTRAAADEVHWTADDGSAGVATGSNKTWQFTWTFPPTLRDGPHTITVQAFLLGSGGSAKPKVVQINRSIPATPDTNVAPLANAGVNTRLVRVSSSNDPVVEINWNQNPETDIRGYNVYRQVGGVPNLDVTLPPPAELDQLACTTVPKGVTATSCVDPLSTTDLAGCAPVKTIPCTFTYYVVAVDSRWTTRANTALQSCGVPPASYSISLGLFPSPDRPGCGSATFTVDVNGGQLKAEPQQPQNLTPTTANGLPELNWDPANQGSGSQIIFYRVYRDPSNPPQYSERIGKTMDASTPLTFTDANPTAATHTYAVTAVNADYQESDPVSVTWP